MENQEQQTSNPAVRAEMHAEAARASTPEQQDTRPYNIRFEEQQKTAREAADRAATAKMSPAEKQIHTLRQHPGFYDGKHPEHAKVMQDYRKALVAADTPEERNALVDGGIEAARSVFGLDAPSAVPPSMRAEYEQSFSQHEANLLRHARAEGWERGVVAELRDHGVELGLRGERMTADDEAAFRTKFGSRISKDQLDLLVRWWRTEVEGGAS